MSHVNGRLEITVLEGKELKKEDLIKNDPYVKVKVHNKILGKGQKTQVAKAGTNPKWGDTIVFNLKDTDLKTKVSFRVYDKDTLKDDKIGRADTTLAELASHQSSEWYQLHNFHDAHKICGYVLVSSKFEGSGWPTAGTHVGAGTGLGSGVTHTGAGHLGSNPGATGTSYGHTGMGHSSTGVSPIGTTAHPAGNTLGTDPSAYSGHTGVGHTGAGVGHTGVGHTGTGVGHTGTGVTTGDGAHGTTYGHSGLGHTSTGVSPIGTTAHPAGNTLGTDPTLGSHGTHAGHTDTSCVTGIKAAIPGTKEHKAKKEAEHLTDTHGMEGRTPGTAAKDMVTTDSYGRTDHQAHNQTGGLGTGAQTGQYGTGTGTGVGTTGTTGVGTTGTTTHTQI